MSIQYFSMGFYLKDTIDQAVQYTVLFQLCGSGVWGLFREKRPKMADWAGFEIIFFGCCNLAPK